MERRETEMELAAMRTLWQESEERWAAIESGVRRLARSDAIGGVRSRLHWVRLALWWELSSGLVAALLLGSYLPDCAGELRFLVPAATLHVVAVLTVAFAAWQLAALARIEYGGPVVEIQRRLLTLRLARVRANRWLLLAAPLLWTLLVVVVPDALAGFDVYRAFGPTWVLANLALGVAVLGTAAWASHRFPGWAQRSRLGRALGDDLTGRRVAAAAGDLDAIAAFEATA